jgi:CDP-6-deoxy-D-xylo-4-hexulose-3-dehydrase
MSKKVEMFEKLFANYIGVKYALMVNSGSSANLLALSILNNPFLGGKQIKEGHEVITPAVTWSTTVFPIVNINAKPVFVDVDLKTFNIDPKKIEKAITKKTKAIMVVHLLGNPCNMKIIRKIAKKYNLFLIEDCCEALGAQFENKKVGGFGDLATFSFFASHHITTMEGGMLVTNNQKLFEIAKSLRTHGWSRDLKNRKQIENKNAKIDSRFLFPNLGYNLRPTELQGAFGIHQIKKLNKFLKIREKNAKFWKKSLAEYSEYITFLEDETKSYNSNMLFAIKITKNKFFTKDQLVNFLEKKGIGTRPVMAGNFVKQPVIKIIPHRISGNLKNSSEIMENAFLIGNHQNIGDNERKYISKTIIKFLNSKIK